MNFRKIAILSVFLLIAVSAESQINNFLGASVYPTFAKNRTSNASFSTGFGAGLTYIFWEYEDWFIKSGVDYLSRSSNVVELPRYFDVPVIQLIDMKYTQEDICVPVVVYYLPYKRGDDAMIVMGGMEIMYTMRSRYRSETYGTAFLSRDDLDQMIQVGFTVGVGYQREISDVLFFNVLPTFNVDFRADNPFTAFGITLELIYGIY